MKKLLFSIVLLCVIQTSFSQNNKGKPFFTGSVNLTFAVNENYVLFQPDDGESLFEPVAVLVRGGFGYQFNRRFAASLHAGFDHHWKFGINTIPTYGTLQYNIVEDIGDTFFIETSYGKLWRPSHKFSDGNYYGVGIGWQIAGEKRWNTIIKLNYHRKSIQSFKNGYLNSVSIGVGFSFF